MAMKAISWAACSLAVFLVCLATAHAEETTGALPPPAGQTVAFTSDIYPLLQKHCFACHGVDVQESGLRLDRKQAMFAGGKSGPALVVGKSDESRLIQLVTGANEKQIVMPPEGQRLSAGEIGLLRAWIDQGANWPDDLPQRSKGADHWAFKRPVRPVVPHVKNADWVRNEIDAFVLSRLESRGLEPSPEADRPALIRRLSLDLLGLPPTPEQVARFVADPAPDAYEQCVDRLLNSPHFGERWGRHWLDLARYADSSGYEFDTPRSVWRYRDWVVDALNRDLPFDQFVIEQIAGDLLPSATIDQTIASGFHCNAMLDPNLRWEAVLDQVNTTGTVLMGLTVGCAQCHSHKFDPLTQREYYGLYAFFDSAGISNFELATASEKAARDALQAQVDAVKKTRTEHEAALRETLSTWEASLSGEERAKLPQPALAALSTTTAERSPDQLTKLVAARASQDPQHQVLSREIDERARQVPQLPATLAMRLEPRETRMFVRGNPERPGEVVVPGVPAFLHPLGSNEKPTRSDLAHWLVAPENPLVTRVTVNRLWDRYFGLGLVDPSNDFGVQTPAPEHQDLLDWLATEFMARGWSGKAMHRLIVCSATYRQRSSVRPDLQTVDPNNRLLARQRRLRLEAEIIRDLSLSAGGLLAATLGGPSVFPHQPQGVLEDRATKATWTISPGADRYRRGIYTWTWRLTPHPMLTLFDAPDASMACTRRDRSNTPVQALTLLNDPSFLECARGLARRVIGAAASDPERFELAFQICLSRDPQADEIELVNALLQEQLAELSGDLVAARKIAGVDTGTDGDVLQEAAWVVVCRAMLSLDEFLTRE